MTIDKENLCCTGFGQIQSASITGFKTGKRGIHKMYLSVSTIHAIRTELLKEGLFHYNVPKCDIHISEFNDAPFHCKVTKRKSTG